jgi:HlyD family secretion protein
LKILDADKQVKPGMTAAVNIIVNQEENVLTVPSRAVRMKNGKRIVYVLKGGAIREVQVEIGASSDTSIEVSSGDLQEGDLVVLNPPFQLDISGGRTSLTE